MDVFAEVVDLVVVPGIAARAAVMLQSFVGEWVADFHAVPKEVGSTALFHGHEGPRNFPWVVSRFAEPFPTSNMKLRKSSQLIRWMSCCYSHMRLR